MRSARCHSAVSCCVPSIQIQSVAAHQQSGRYGLRADIRCALFKCTLRAQTCHSLRLRTLFWLNSTRRWRLCGRNCRSIWHGEGLPLPHQMLWNADCLAANPTTRKIVTSKPSNFSGQICQLAYGRGVRPPTWHCLSHRCCGSGGTGFAGHTSL